MGKGSKRRPCNISESERLKNWERIFNKKGCYGNKKSKKPLVDGKLKKASC